MIKIIQLEKVSQSQSVSLAAARGQLTLIERGFSRYGHRWDSPAIAAMDGETCVGVLLVHHEPDEKIATVRLAYCNKNYPKLLAQLLINFRQWCRNRDVDEVYFVSNTDNDLMAKAARATRAERFSSIFRVTLGNMETLG